MATPRLMAFIDKAWPKIDGALREGLKEAGGQELTRLVTVADLPGSLLEHVSLSWGDVPSETLEGAIEERPLVAAASAIHQLRRICVLSRHDLDPAGPSSIMLHRLGLWAWQSRQAEHAWILSTIAAAGTTNDQLNAPELQEMDNNWRVVAIGANSDLRSACVENEIDFVSPGPQFKPPGIRALAYPIDSFAVARLEDFTPSFDMADEAITLMLTERIELLFNTNGQDILPRAYGSIVL